MIKYNRKLQNKKYTKKMENEIYDAKHKANVNLYFFAMVHIIFTKIEQKPTHDPVP